MIQFLKESTGVKLRFFLCVLKPLECLLALFGSLCAMSLICTFFSLFAYLIEVSLGLDYYWHVNESIRLCNVTHIAKSMIHSCLGKWKVWNCSLYATVEERIKRTFWTAANTFQKETKLMTFHLCYLCTWNSCSNTDCLFGYYSPY